MCGGELTPSAENQGEQAAPCLCSPCFNVTVDREETVVRLQWCTNMAGEWMVPAAPSSGPILAAIVPRSPLLSLPGPESPRFWSYSAAQFCVPRNTSEEGAARSLHQRARLRGKLFPLQKILKFPVCPGLSLPGQTVPPRGKCGEGYLKA